MQSAYVHHKEVKAALGVKIVAPDLEKAIAGSRLLVVGPDDDEDDLELELEGLEVDLDTDDIPAIRIALEQWQQQRNQAREERKKKKRRIDHLGEASEPVSPTLLCQSRL